MQSTLSILVAGRYLSTRRAEVSDPSILRVFIRDHLWAFLLIFGMAWMSHHYIVADRMIAA